MNSKTTLSVTEARKDFFNLLDQVEKSNVPYTLTVKGKPKAVIMNADEYDSWMETHEIMSDPKILDDIKKAEAEYQKGEYVNWSKVKNDLGIKEKFLVADKPKHKYGSSKK